MGRYVLRRLLLVIPMLVGLTIASFALSHQAGGDPARAYLRASGLGRPPTEAEVSRARHQLGLDRPLVEQYLSWTGQVVRGNLGRSYSTGRPVLRELAERAPYTLALTLPAILLALLIALPTGTWAAARHRGVVDHAVRAGSLAGACLPSFWSALVLITVFAVRLSWFPVAGASGLRSQVLPIVTLALAPAAILTRFTRAAVLGALGTDHVRTARAKGLKESQILWRHAVPGALVPVVTATGVVVGGLLAGDAVVETVFSWPGVGLLSVNAIQARDYPVIAALAVYGGVMFALVNIAVDVTCALIDPRIRLGRRAEGRR